MVDTTAYHEAKGGSDRGFGIVFAVVFAIIACWPLLHGGGIRLWALGIGAAFLAVALINPGILAIPNRLWLKFGLLLGAIVAPIVMILVFFVVVTPMALVMRAIGRDPLRRKIDPNETSYWIRRSDPMGPMKNQF